MDVDLPHSVTVENGSPVSLAELGEVIFQAASVDLVGGNWQNPARAELVPLQATSLNTTSSARAST